MDLLYVFQSMHVFDFQLTIDRILIRIDDDERPLASVSECDRGEASKRCAASTWRARSCSTQNHWWTEEQQEEA
jgi:hypothetical protein